MMLQNLSRKSNCIRLLFSIFKVSCSQNSCCPSETWTSKSSIRKNLFKHTVGYQLRAGLGLCGPIDIRLQHRKVHGLLSISRDLLALRLLIPNERQFLAVSTFSMSFRLRPVLFPLRIYRHFLFLPVCLALISDRSLLSQANCDQAPRHVFREAAQRRGRSPLHELR